MKYLHLIWASLFRSKTRTLLTLLSVVTAFLLFGMLDSVRVAFNSSAQRGRLRPAHRHLEAVDHADRCRTASRRRSPRCRVSRTSRTRSGSAASTRTPKNFFPNFAVGPGFMELYPEYVLPPEQLQGLRGRTHGRDRRRSARQAVRLEARRHDPAAGHDLPDQGQQRLDLQAGRHLQAGGQEAPGRRAADDVQLEVLRRGQRLHQGPRELVRSRAGRRQQGDRRSPGRSTRSPTTRTTRRRRRANRPSTRHSSSSSPTSV